MKLSTFFKPTWRKIFVSIIIFVISLIGTIHAGMIFEKPNPILSAIGFIPWFIIMIVAFGLFKEPNPILGILIILFINIIYAYLLSCIIDIFVVLMLKKLKK
jgi:hypothetical protein